MKRISFAGVAHWYPSWLEARKVSFTEIFLFQFLAVARTSGKFSRIHIQEHFNYSCMSDDFRTFQHQHSGARSQVSDGEIPGQEI